MVRKDENIDRQIGERIKQLRMENGFTRAELGDLVGLSLSGLAKIERGERTLTIQNLRNMNEVFQSSADYIIYGEQYTEEEKEHQIQMIERICADNQKRLNEILALLRQQHPHE